MNIIKEIEDKLKASPSCMTALNSCPSPAIGGVEAIFYKDINEETVYVVLNDEGNFTYGLIPEKYADKARSINYDPYNDTAYTKESVSLACSALNDAIYYQRDNQRKAREGGGSIEINFYSHELDSMY